MQKYFNNVVTTAGIAVPGATVAVTLMSGGAATLYSGNGTGQLASNTVTTDANGYFQFYAPDNRYVLTISASNITTYTLTDVLINDPRMSVNETPTGLINSSNTIFALANTPAGFPSIQISGAVRQGGSGAFLPLVLGIDFTLSGNVVTMTIAPDTGSNLVFTYGY